MTIIKNTASLAVVFLLAAIPANQAMATDAFKEFKQLGGTAKMPKLNAFTVPDAPAAPAVATRNVRFEARLTEDGETMEDGLVWRIFSPEPGDDGKLPLLASSEGGSTSFPLIPGDYFINVSFGRAGTSKKVKVAASGENSKEVLVLDAGGFVLDAEAGGNKPIPDNQLRFSIYSSEVRDDGERGLVIADVKPETIIRLNAGTYHIVSQYGDVNAVVRADIQVEAGKLTEATLQHHAAKITLKLVSEEGGEAVADTAWSVLTNAGDIVKESVSAFSTMVLAEGEYTAVARNKDAVFQRNFTVVSGKDADIELLMKDEAPEISYDTE